MLRDTAKLEEHIKQHPTDANAVIALLKMRSDNFVYEFNLAQKRKHEIARSFTRKRKEG